MFNVQNYVNELDAKLAPRVARAEEIKEAHRQGTATIDEYNELLKTTGYVEAMKDAISLIKNSI